MKRILSKYWLVLFIAVLIAWPAAVISMQRVKPIDEATLDKLEALLEEKLQMSSKTIAPPPPEWDMEKKEVFMRDNLQPYFNELLPIVAGDTLSAKLNAAEEVYAPFIQYYDSLTSGTISQDWKLLERQIAAKIQRAVAQRAILTKNWDEALRRLYSTANIGNSCREQSLMGMLIATATRFISYHGYNQLLHAGAPIEIKRAALEQLIRLRDTEPYFNENIVFAETLFSLKNRREILENPEIAKQRLGIDQVGPVLPTQTIMMGVIANLTVLEQKNLARQWSGLPWAPLKGITDSASKRWISKRAQNQSPGAPYQYGFYRWTDIPAAEKLLKRMIEKEPWVYKSFGFSEETYKYLDPWTLILFSNLNYLRANLDEASTRCKVTSATGRLLEAAFAAQIYQNEKGVWPNAENLMEMIPVLPKEVYTPIQINPKQASGDLRSALWASVLPTKLPGKRVNPYDLSSGQWSATFNGQIDEARQKAAEALALKQILEQYPRLVEDVKVNIQRPNSWPKEFNSMEEAEDVLSAAGSGYDMTSQPPAPKVNLFFSATRRAPDSVWILWSPGPDGEDDGGTIQYDPTNGTMSRGDLIVFPEVF